MSRYRSPPPVRSARYDPAMKTVALLIALIATPVLAEDGAGPYSFTLSGKAFDERCVKLAADESIRYSFRSSADVDFNIHYHRANEVFFPVKQSAVREANATFRAQTEQDFCLMWEHTGPGNAKIEGTLERVSLR